jgi:hypothetical protein
VGGLLVLVHCCLLFGTLRWGLDLVLQSLLLVLTIPPLGSLSDPFNQLMYDPHVLQL